MIYDLKTEILFSSPFYDFGLQFLGYDFNYVI